jgi:hypothetical protein
MALSFLISAFASACACQQSPAHKLQRCCKHQTARRLHCNQCSHYNRRLRRRSCHICRRRCWPRRPAMQRGGTDANFHRGCRGRCPRQAHTTENCMMALLRLCPPGKPLRRNLDRTSCRCCWWSRRGPGKRLRPRRCRLRIRRQSKGRKFCKLALFKMPREESASAQEREMLLSSSPPPLSHRPFQNSQRTRCQWRRTWHGRGLGQHRSRSWS